jgi:hypothetical protein
MKTPEQFTEHQAEIEELQALMVERHAKWPEEAEKFIKCIPEYFNHGGEHYVFRSRKPQRLIKSPLVDWSRNPESAIDPMLDREVQKTDLPAFRNYITALECGRGGKRLEQIIGATTTRALGVVVEAIDAQPLELHKPNPPLDTRDFHTLFEAYEDLYARGLTYDSGRTNVLHKTGDGFYIIDYKLRDGDGPGVEDSVLYFASEEMLTQYGDYAAGHAYVEACNERYGSDLAERVQELWESQRRAPSLMHRNLGQQ